MSSNIKTKKETFDLDGLPIEIFRITNAEDLIEDFFGLDEKDEAFQDEQIPYWADLWHSAIALGHFLVQQKLIAPGMKVTEIGCGLGFSGIVASKLGAEVIFTDYLQAAVDFAQKNWNLNEGNPARFERMDWRNPNPDFSADLILAADVAYETKAYDALLKTFETLCAPGKTILVSDPNRVHTRPFLMGLNGKNFDVTAHSMQQKLDMTTVQVNIYQLTKRA